MVSAIYFSLLLFSKKNIKLYSTKNFSFLHSRNLWKKITQKNCLKLFFLCFDSFSSLFVELEKEGGRERERGLRTRRWWERNAQECWNLSEIKVSLSAKHFKAQSNMLCKRISRAVHVYRWRMFAQRRHSTIADDRCFPANIPESSNDENSLLTHSVTSLVAFQFSLITLPVLSRFPLCPFIKSSLSLKGFRAKQKFWLNAN